MITWKQFIEGQSWDGITRYYQGWDEIVHGLKNWGSGAKKTPQQWAREMIDKLDQMGITDEHRRGAYLALKKFLSSGRVEYIGSSYLSDNPHRSPFSAN